MSELVFETLVINNDYEIAVNHYPYIIRRISNHRIIKESTNTKGYRCVYLNGKCVKIHRIIALQWIQNDDPDNKTEVDHINKHRDDNRIVNLRWCTSSTNQRNKTSYRGRVVEYLDQLSDYAFEFPEYNEHVFYDYWFDPETDCFYYYTGAAFREITYSTQKSGALFIHAKNENNVQATITLNNFKREYASDFEQFNIDHNLE